MRPCRLRRQHARAWCAEDRAERHRQVSGMSQRELDPSGMIDHNSGTKRSNRDRSSRASLHALQRAVVGHDDVMGHGLDDVVQWFVFPVGDAATGGIQRHAKRCGPEHTGHFHIGRTPIGSRQVAFGSSQYAAGRSAEGLRKIGLVMDLCSLTARRCRAGCRSCVLAIMMANAARRYRAASLVRYGSSG